MPIPAALSRILPFLKWGRPSFASARRDAWAGISVALVLIPQAIAYASLAGMPPETGLYAALVPSIVGVLWGSSALLAVGPVALTSLLTFGSLSSLAKPGSADWVSLAIWLSLYAGLVQFALAFFDLDASPTWSLSRSWSVSSIQPRSSSSFRSYLLCLALPDFHLNP